jgi:hypothetical protein
MGSVGQQNEFLKINYSIGSSAGVSDDDLMSFLLALLFRSADLLSVVF